MLRFLDTANNPMPQLYRHYPTGPVSVLPLRFPCRDGYSLVATIPEGVTAEISEDGSTWHDLAEPFDLSPYAPAVTDFQLRTVSPTGTNDIELQIGEFD